MWVGELGIEREYSLTGLPGRTSDEFTATIRANAFQWAVPAARTERALIGTDHGMPGIHRQAGIALLAIGLHRQHGLISPRTLVFLVRIAFLRDLDTLSLFDDGTYRYSAMARNEGRA